MTQPVASMTGYARAEGAASGCGIVCEIRSVNARGLDLRMRLAPGLDSLEAEIRRRISDRLARGAVSVSMTLEREQSSGEVVINEQALAAILAALDDLSGRIEAQPPRLDGILAIKGVLDIRERPIDAHRDEDLHAAVLDCIDSALRDLIEARRTEGERLGAVLSAQIDRIEDLARQAEAHPSRTREAVIARLRQQLADLAEAGSTLGEEKLYQEAMLLVTKSDIREELDRLFAHVAAARQLVAEGVAVGRRLDFLSQEFNREANTLCAKSNSVELTAIGLDLKAVIDQLREQIQNIE
ncbi:MAG TPA: YicC/YloC family endoribonuclease [Devosiaceae bacterium]